MDKAADQVKLTSLDVRKQQDLRKAALNCLRKTVVLVWSTVNFPAGNKAIADAADAFKASIADVLRLHGSFVLALLQTRLYFQDTRADARDEMTQYFIREMANRRIRKIIFWRGVSEADLEGFSPVFSLKAKDLMAQGGSAALLARNRVKNIVVIENEYVEPGEAALLKREYWQEKLDKAGLSSREVPGYLAGKGRLPPLLSDELRLLVEAMKDPKFLAEIMVHVAMVDAPDRPPQPGEIIRLCRRFEYILLANALFDTEETPRILTRAMRSLNPRLRADLLAEKVRLQAEGCDFVDDATFGFLPDDYADYMVHAFERTGRWPDALDALHRPSPEAEAFGQAFRARLMTSAAWSADAAGTEAQVRLIAVQACSPTPLPVPAPAAGQVGPLPRVEPQAALQGLRAASESCQEDLEAGHIHALLAMVTGGMKREVEIFDRLIELLEMRLYVGRPEDAARLLPIMFGPALDDAARKRLRERVVRKLEDKYRAELVKHLTGEALSGSEAAGPPARVGAEVFGEAFWTLLFRGLCDDARRDPSAMVRHLAATFEKALSPMLMTAAKDPDPMRRLRAVELLAAFASDEARYVAAKAMEDPDENVRIAAIFTLGGGASTRAVERILAVASGENEKASQGERCAAIYALGRLREARAIPVCDAVLAQKGLFGRSKDIELKLCAAAGLRDIGTPESLAVLKQRVSSIKSSRLDTFLGKLSGRSGSEPPSS